MKILFVTDLYPVKDDEKFTPKTLKMFVRDWQSMGHSVDVLKPNFLLNSFVRNKPFYKTGEYGNVYNVNYFTPFLGDIKHKLPKLDNYDITIAHMPSGEIFASKLNKRFVCGIHNADIDILTKPIYSIYFKHELEMAHKKALALFCRSHVLRDKFLRLYPELEEKVFVAPSGIKKEYIVKKNFEGFNNSVKVLTCANLIKRKNIDILINALKDNHNIELTVIGDGKERSKLEKINKNVKFTGFLDKTNVLNAMRNSDIFILPSVNETFGMVYLEAMASGCITVCTKNDGIDGIIKNKVNGFLTNPDENSIKNTISEIINMPESKVLSLLKNCYNTVCQYQSHTCSSQYLEKVLKII